ncbi:MAG: type II toxin-antitoxin system prevent-host-death family antitoxin [Pseudomonadota bacterium]
MKRHPRYIVTVSQFRKNVAGYINHVRYGDEWICIQRRNCDPVYLVCKADFDLIMSKVDDLVDGPKDPKTGKRPPKGFWWQLLDILSAERKQRG